MCRELASSCVSVQTVSNRIRIYIFRGADALTLRWHRDQQRQKIGEELVTRHSWQAALQKAARAIIMSRNTREIDVSRIVFVPRRVKFKPAAQDIEAALGRARQAKLAEI